MSIEISDKDYKKMKQVFIDNKVPLCKACGFMGNCKFESPRDPCPLLVRSVSLFFDRYKRNIRDWEDEKQVETLKKAAEAYMEALYTQLSYMIGMSINQRMIASHGGDTEEFGQSKSDELFKEDCMIAKHNIVQLGKLVKLFKELHSDDKVIATVILEDDCAMNISIEK